MGAVRGSATLTGGASSTCARFGFQTESTLFETDSNLPQNLTDKTSAFPYSKKSK
jgi:hypothetical protein